MRKKLLLSLLLFLLAGCGTTVPEIAPDFTVGEESAFYTEAPKPDITTTVTTTAPLTTTAKTTTTTATTTTTTTEATTIVYGNAENGENEIIRGEKACRLTLRRPLSEEELDILSGVNYIQISLHESVDLSVLARFAPLECLRIECDPTSEPFELIGVSELLCSDIETIYIGGSGSQLLDLSGAQNNMTSFLFIWEVVLRTDPSTSFPSLNKFSVMGAKLESEDPFLPFANAKEVYVRACTLDDINTIRVFSEVEKLTLYDGDTSKLNVLQDFPYLSEIALFGSPPRMCSIDALKNLPAIESIHYGFTCFTEEEEALLKEWYPGCYLHVLYGL